MPPSLTRAEINALGRRLARPGPPDPADLELLAAYQEEHQPASQTVGAALRAIVDRWPDASQRKAFTISSRTKTSSTLVDKLGRGTRLSTMQDVVGHRVSTSSLMWTWTDQDRFADMVEAILPGVRRIDRRAAPSSGYRAIHLVVSHDDFSVEVQVRTRLQDIWANQTEALGDLWGRGIRYGLPPEGSSPVEIAARQRAVDANLELAERIFDYERALDDALRRRAPLEVARRGLTDQRAITAAVDEIIGATLKPRIDALIAALEEFQFRRGLVPYAR